MKIAYCKLVGEPVISVKLDVLKTQLYKIRLCKMKIAADKLCKMNSDFAKPAAEFAKLDGFLPVGPGSGFLGSGSLAVPQSTE